MESTLSLLPLLSPVALIVASFFAWQDQNPRPRRALVATRIAYLFTLPIATFTALLVALHAPLVSPLLGVHGLGFSIRIDAISAVMFALVSLLGAAVLHFSRSYLSGDPRQGIFLGDLALTIACVMGLVLAGNLVQLALLWSATSLALHRLLLFYGERPRAIVAARKKFVVARAGDACLFLAVALLVREFGSGDIGSVLAGASRLSSEGHVPTSVGIAAALVGLTAVLKAAQFPAHGWLIEMQETPTPVSALLHAGILNGGTFLVVRLAAVEHLFWPVRAELALFGGMTALFASVVMVTDSRVKATLAYSSAAHMGFMLLLCGMGSYSVAMAHLVAHSFYKAHAFLSSGSAVDQARMARVPRKSMEVTAVRLGASAVAATVIVVGVATLLRFQVSESFTNTVLAMIMILSLMHLMAQALSSQTQVWLVVRTAVSAVLTALAFYTLERLGGVTLKGTVAEASLPQGMLAAIITSVIGAFGAVVLLQLLLPEMYLRPSLARVYVLARNGLYANVYFDRLVGAGRLVKAKSRSQLDQALPTGENELGSIENLDDVIERVTRSLAPVWPLKTFVAVNPFHGLTDQHIVDAARIIARTVGERMTMPRSFYADAIATGRIKRPHLAEALGETDPRVKVNLPQDVDGLIKLLQRDPLASSYALVPTVPDVVGSLHGHDWGATVVERIGAWAAAYFDEGQASWRSPWQKLPPYEAFRAEAALDATPELLGARGFRAAIQALPLDAMATIRHALARLALPQASVEIYLRRVLASIGGWASYTRCRVWCNELHGTPDSTVTQILAIRLAWEVALLETFTFAGADRLWAAAVATISRTSEAADIDLAIDLVLQNAYEKAWQEAAFRKLDQPSRERRAIECPRVQASFCIDVRSEVFRRALEDVDPHCMTIGFAGFFGFPVEYVPLGEEQGRAQCPVLLTPKSVVVESVIGSTEEVSARVASSRVLDRRARNAWKSFKTSAIACFGFVGPVGLLYLPKLLLDGLGITRTVPHPSRDGVSVRHTLGPELSPHTHNGRRVGLTLEERLSMAEGLLRGMSLTSGFARLVLLVGHGATTVNNPHSAALDCGACGGNTGEANARIAAMVLNESKVRAGLARMGIVIPEDTVFLGCMHDTTTDVVTIFDRHGVPSSHAQDLERIDAILASAGAIARRTRAPMLGEKVDDPRVDAKIMARSRDWAQVRPEWGLAGCAAFIVAPRERTAGIDLGGRSFLHSYDWRQDKAAGFQVLELIMTAPMVVGSWISLQYYASTVAKRVFGSGNKVLHNVVGTVGVLEGNCGDLRVGLPWQSVHDGERLVHEPMRLTVIIEAPIEAMNVILEKHPSVRALVDNGWLHLYALGDTGCVTHRYVGGLAWTPVTSISTELAA